MLDTKQPPSAENDTEYLESIIKHLDGKLEETKKQLVVKEKEVDIMKLRVGSIVAVYGDRNDDHDISYRCAIIRKIKPASRAADTQFTVAYEGDQEYTEIQLGDRKFGKCIIQDGKPVAEDMDHPHSKGNEVYTTKKGEDLESVLKQFGETLEETTKELAEKEKEMELLKLKVGSKIAIYDDDDDTKHRLIDESGIYHYATIRKIEAANEVTGTWFTVLYEGDQEHKRIELGKMKWEWCSLVYSKKK